MKVQTDFIGNGSAQGDIAALLLNQKRLDPGAMRPWLDAATGKTYITVHKGGDTSDIKNYQNIQVNSTGTLRREEWMALDSAILNVKRQRLGGFEDLQSKGLVYNLGNAMGTTVLEYHNISDAMEAELSMDGITRGDADRVVYESVYLPIPITHVDFDINLRALSASRNLGNPLDTSMVEAATRRILEKFEAMLFTNTTFAFSNGTIYSYVNHPKRNTVAGTESWDDSATGAEIVQDIRRMKTASIAAHHYGPWTLYVPTAYESRLDDDYGTNYVKTIRQRILEINGINEVKVVDTLAEGNVLLVQMTSDVVRLINGMDIQVIEWKTEGGMVSKFKVMAIKVPQIRNDHYGNSGLVHLSIS